jgi:hypothetical protein
MNLIKYGHIIGRGNNVVWVNFGSESDPPAPKFPSANGLRPVKREECEPQCVASIGPASGAGLTQGNSSTRKRLSA